MRLLLFTLLCILTMLILRMIQRGTRPRAPGRAPEPKPESPAVRSDEIVDVPFEEFSSDEQPRKGAG